MSKLNKQAGRRGATGPIATTEAQTRTHEGAAALVRDVKSELFLLGVTNFVGEDTFYEKADARDARHAALIEQAAIEDPLWTVGFLTWLRNVGNMRHAPLVGAAHFVKARLAAKAPSVAASTLFGSAENRDLSRTVIDTVLVRADEPTDLLAYWLNTFGRSVPKPVKRGLADAVRRLYTERALLKYDTASKAVRFGDLIEIVHPAAVTAKQGALFTYALDRRRHEAVPSEALTTVRAQAEWRRNAASVKTVAQADALLSPEHLRWAGLTWEDVLSALGNRVNKKKLWEALIPNMGYMALLRNLRNFDEAMVGEEGYTYVARKLADPTEVARSRQFPYRFLAAYENVTSVRWHHALDLALTASVTNVPDTLTDSLVLVDTSASMSQTGFSKRSTMNPVKAAAVFGVTLALKGADLYGFANSQFRHDVRPGSSLIAEVGRFVARVGEVGHGTHIADAVRRQFVPGKHKRIFIISDMQTMDPLTGEIMGGYGTTSRQRQVVPNDVPVYGFNLAGYRPAAFPTGPIRIEMGALVDATFKMVPLIEQGKRCDWPWTT